MRNIFIIFLFCIVSNQSVSQGTFKVASGSNSTWSTAATWTLESGTDADGIPDADDIVILDNTNRSGAYTISVSGTGNACAQLVVGYGGSANIITLNITGGSAAADALQIGNGAGYDLVINDNGVVNNSSAVSGGGNRGIEFTSSSSSWQMTGTGKYIHNQPAGAFPDAASGNITDISFAPTSVFEVQNPNNWNSNTGGLRANYRGVYGSLTINIAMAAGIGTNLGTGNTLAISGDLLVTNNSTLRQNTTGATAGLITIAGNVIVNTGSSFYGSSTTGNGGTITVSGNVSGGGQVGASLSSGYGTFRIGGNLTSFYNDGSAGILEFVGGSSTSILNPLGSTIRNLVVNKAQGVSLGSNVQVGSALTLSVGDLAINGFTLTLQGAVSGTGTLTGSASSNLVIGGNAGTLNFTTGARLLKDFTLNASSSATLGTALEIIGGASFGTVIVNNLATLTTGDNLILKSDVNGTARIGNSAGSITGNVTVERFIGGVTPKKAWRLLSAPFTTASGQTINASWQSGTHITNAAGNNTGGFDAYTPTTLSSGNSSIRYFNGSALATPANTTTVKITDNGGAYFLYVRGSRTPSYMSDVTLAATNTTLQATGAISQGTLDGNNGTSRVGIIGTGVNFSLIPNPYPSNVDFEAIRNHADNGGGTLQTFYIWDANLAGTNGVGAYRTVTTDGTDYTLTPPGGTDNAARYIQSGQAFWIPGKTQLTFTEGMKVANTPNTNVFRTTNNLEQLVVNLSIKESASQYSLADGVRAMFDNSYNANVTSEDAAKLSNFGENLSIFRSNSYLAIQKRPVIAAYDTIFLKLWNTAVKEYRFTVNPTNFSAGLNAYLEDAYLNTSTPLSLTAATDVDFAITADAGSKNIDRFRIVFRPSSVMPVSFTSIKAYEKGNTIEVAWNVAGESDIHHYEVEKSADGRNFSMMSSVKAKGNENSSVAYTSLDNSPLTGNNYYRVKSVSLSNEVKYTSIVNVRLGKGGEAISVYPNPVKGNTIGLQLTNLEKGSYTVNVYNTNGQLVATKMLQHGGGSASEQIVLPTSATKGVYQLEVRGDNSRYVQTIILQ